MDKTAIVTLLYLCFHPVIPVKKPPQPNGPSGLLKCHLGSSHFSGRVEYLLEERSSAQRPNNIPQYSRCSVKIHRGNKADSSRYSPPVTALGKYPQSAKRVRQQDRGPGSAPLIHTDPQLLSPSTAAITRINLRNKIINPPRVSLLRLNPLSAETFLLIRGSVNNLRCDLGLRGFLLGCPLLRRSLPEPRSGVRR